MSEPNEEVVVDTTNNEGEGDETVTISKKDYDKLNQDFGSIKREHKDLKKELDEFKKSKVETPVTNQPDSSLLEKAYLAARGITTDDEVELALLTAKKWGVGIDKLVGDDDWIAKLDKHRTQKANVEATSGVKGTAGTSQAKMTPEYWLAKGTPPSATDIPDVKARRKINVAMFKAGKKDGTKFYNE